MRNGFTVGNDGCFRFALVAALFFSSVSHGDHEWDEEPAPSPGTSFVSYTDDKAEQRQRLVVEEVEALKRMVLAKDPKREDELMHRVQALLDLEKSTKGYYDNVVFPRPPAGLQHIIQLWSVLPDSIREKAARSSFGKKERFPFLPEK